MKGKSKFDLKSESQISGSGNLERKGKHSRQSSRDKKQ